MWKRVLLGVVAATSGLIAWQQRDLDPDAWREFARESPGPEVVELASDYERDAAHRWMSYLAALRSGDDEAFRLAARLCPLIGNRVHPSEEFIGALGWSLERRPAEVFELVKPCFPVRIACMDFDEDSSPAELKASRARRRAAVTPLLDGGWSEAAKECLDELR